MKNILLAWCDNGYVDGKFAETLISFTNQKEIPITTTLRVQGNQIGRQRQLVANFILENKQFDGILWIDSDISANLEDLQKIFYSFDEIERPVVSGIYYIVKDNGIPKAAVFNFSDKENIINYIDDLEPNTLRQVDCAGFGFVLMHRSVIEKMNDFYEGKPLFNEVGVGDNFVSEDINFFKLMKNINLPLYCNTDVQLDHIKRFPINKQYYDLYNNLIYKNNKKEKND